MIGTFEIHSFGSLFVQFYVYFYPAYVYMYNIKEKLEFEREGVWEKLEE